MKLRNVQLLVGLPLTAVGFRSCGAWRLGPIFQTVSNFYPKCVVRQSGEADGLVNRWASNYTCVGRMGPWRLSTWVNQPSYWEQGKLPSYQTVNVNKRR